MAEKIVRARKAGVCSHKFAHPSLIQPGDVTMVTAVMPRSQDVRDFGVAPWTRYRTCAWCVRDQMTRRYSRERTAPALVARWRELTGELEPGGSENDS